MSNGISIIVCCHNGASRIPETLKYLFAVNVPDDFSCEVVVVNNNSSDDTRSVAMNAFEESGNLKTSFKIVDEVNPGLSFARAKGIRESTFELILFCDDDNHLDPDYLQVAKEIFDQDSSVAIAGGWVKPRLPFYPGKWIESNYSALAIEANPKKPGYVDWVFGAGMVIRKRIYKELDQKGISLALTGRIGMKQTSGDDAELCHLVRFLGYKVYYCPQLVLYHKIAPHRLTRMSFIKANYRNVFMVPYFYIMDHLMKHSGMPPGKMYLRFLKSRLCNLIYFFPRTFFGKNNFYSFVMLYQNFQLVVWIFLKRRKFFETYDAVKGNLYGNGRG